MSKQLDTTPTLPGSLLLGSLAEFRKDRLGLMLRASRRYPTAVRMRLGFLNAFIVNSPELAKEVLVTQAHHFIKDVGLRTFGRPVLGAGLLTNEGTPHRERRKMLAPKFVRREVAHFADVMTSATEEMVEGWGAKQVLDLDAEMNRLTLDIVGRTLFSANVASEAGQVTAALKVLMEGVVQGVNSLIPIPPIFPTPRNIRNRRAVRRLDGTVYGMIEQRRRSGRSERDFLSMLLATREEGGTKGLSDKEVRDEAMTIFLAGHETTSNVLAWTWYLLLSHPTQLERVQAEARAVLQGRSPTLADLQQLPFTLQVLKEAMRLYPPVYILGREPTQDVQIGRHHVKRGTFVMINTFGLQRASEVFDAPDAFRPERFEGDAEKAMPKFSYMPFGAGPRFCIGNNFAQMQAHLVLATVMQRVDLTRAFADA